MIKIIDKIFFIAISLMIIIIIYNEIKKIDNDYENYLFYLIGGLLLYLVFKYFYVKNN